MSNTQSVTPDSFATALPRRARWFTGAFVALAAAAAVSAAPQNRTIEECIESGTELVSLPSAAGGSLSGRQCSGCPSVRLRFDARTRFFIGKEAVSYAKLREAAARGDLRLDLFYDPKTLNLTRLRLASAGRSK